MSADTLPLSRLCEPELAELLSHWLTVRGERSWPLHRDLRPERFPRALPHIALVERLGDGAKRLRIRLTGEDIANRTLGYVRGAFVEDVTPVWYRDHLLATYTGALDAGEPLLQDVHSRYRARRFHYRRLMLPVTLAGDRPDVLIVATVLSPELVEYLRPQPDFR